MLQFRGASAPPGSPDLAPDADWASVREQRSSSNTLNRVPWGQPRCSGGAGIPARGPGRLPLENDDSGSVSGHLAQLAWSPPRRPPGGGIPEASPHHDSITFWRSRNNRSTHLAARLRLGWHGGPALALGPSVLVHADLCGRAPRRVPAIPWDPPSCTPASPVRAGQAWAAAEAPPTVAPQIL